MLTYLPLSVCHCVIAPARHIGGGAANKQPLSLPKPGQPSFNFLINPGGHVVGRGPSRVKESCTGDPGGLAAVLQPENHRAGLLGGFLSPAGGGACQKSDMLQGPGRGRSASAAFARPGYLLKGTRPPEKFAMGALFGTVEELPVGRGG